MKNLGKRQGIFSLFNIKRVIFACAVMFCAMGAWTQTTYTWNSSLSTGNWTDSANWSPTSGTGSTYPGDGTTNDTAIFGSVAAVNLPASLTVGTITANTAVTLSGSSTLTVTIINGAGSVSGEDTDLIMPTGASVSTTISFDSLTANGTISLQGSITTDGTNASSAGQSYSDAVTIGGSGATLNSSASDITFGAGITLNQALTLETSANISVTGAVIGGQNLTVNNATGITFNGSAINVGTFNVTSGTASFSGTSSLTATTATTQDVIVTGSGNFTLNNDLIVNGALTNNGTFTSTGGTIQAESIAGATGAWSLVGAVTTTAGGQTYGGAVTITGATTISATTTRQTIQFIDTVQDDADVENHNLTVTATGGTITFGSTLGATDHEESFNPYRLGELRLTANTINLTNSVRTVGKQTYDGAVNVVSTGAFAISADPEGSVLAASDIEFTSTFTGDGRSLNTAANRITFGGNVSNFSNFSITPLVTIGGNITTTGAQTYSKAVTLTSDVTLIAYDTVAFTAKDITFNSTVASPTTRYNLVIGSNAQPAGIVTFGNTVGATDNLSAVTVNATTININGESVITTGEQTYRGAVVLGGASNDKSFTSNTSSNIEFSSTLSGAKNVIVSASTGTATFGGLIGTDADRLTSIDIAASAININGGSVFTSGAQTYTGNIATGDATLTLDASVSNINFEGSVTADTLSLEANTLNFEATGDQQINTISALTFDGAVDILAGATTTFSKGFSQTGGAVTLSGTITSSANGLSFNGATTLTGNTTIIATNQNVTFGSTIVNDATSGINANLTIDVGTGASGGTITHGGGIGADSANGPSTVKPGEITLTASSIVFKGGYVRTTGNHTYTGAVSLSPTVSPAEEDFGIRFNSSTGSISFSSTVNGVDSSSTPSSDYKATFALQTANNNSITFNGDVTNIAYFFINSASGNIILNGSEITSTQSQRYLGAVSLSKDNTLTSTGSYLEFANTVTGEQTLNLDAYAAITFTGDVGESGALLTKVDIQDATIVKINRNFYAGALTFTDTTSNISFTPTAAQTINVPDDSFSTVTGSVTIAATDTNTTTFTNGFTQKTGGGTVSLAGTVNAGGNGLSFSGTTNLASETTLNATGTSGNVSFNGAVVGDSRTLNLSASGTGSNGVITFANDVGSSSALLTEINVATALQVIFNQNVYVSTTFTVPDAAHLQFLSSSASQVVGIPTINTEGDLTVQASTTSGETTSFSSGISQTGDGRTVSLSGNIVASTNGVSFAGNVTTAASTSITAASATGDITFTSTSALTTNGNLVLTATDKIVTFGCDIDGSHTFTVDATTLAFIGRTFDVANPDGQSIDVNSFYGFEGAVQISTGGNVHKTTFVQGFNQTESGLVTIRGYVVASTGNLSFNGNVSLSGTANLIADNQDVTFGGTLSGLVPLTIEAGATGTVTFSEATSNLGALTVTASQINVSGGQVQTHARDIDIGAGAAHATTGNQTYNGNVVIDKNTTFTMTGSSSTAGDEVITFNGTVNGDAAGRSLTVTGAEVVIITGEVGTTNTISSVDITASATSNAININGGAVTTTGTQTYTGYLQTGNTTTLESTGAGNTSVITFEGSIASDYGLTITSNYSVSFANGESVNVGELTIETKEGGVSFGSSLGMHGATNISATDNGDVTFDSTINKAQALTVSALTGDVTFTGAVGGNEALASLNVNANTINIHNNITTNNTIPSSTNGQRYNGSVVLAGSATDITLSTSSAGGIEFISTLNGAKNLGIIATGRSVTFGGIVGTSSSSLNRLASIDITATNIYANGTSIFTTGAQTYTGNLTSSSGGNITLNATNAAIINFEGNVTASELSLTAHTLNFNVAGNQQIDTNPMLSFTGNVTDNTTGTLTFSRGFTQSGADDTNTIAGTIVATEGPLSFAGATTLTGATIVTASGSGVNDDIIFSNTIAGDFSLEVNATDNDIQFGGAVATLESVNITASTIAINGGSVTTTGAQTYTGAVTLGGSVSSSTFTSTDDGNIQFTSTVNGAKTFNVSAVDNEVTFGGIIGTDASSASNANRPTRLSVTATTINVDGGSIFTSGAQTYAGAVELGNDTSLNAASETITFTGNVTGSTHTLGLAGGTLVLNNTEAQTINVENTPLVFTGAFAKNTQFATTFTNGFSQLGSGAVTLRNSIIAGASGLSFEGAASLSGSTNLTAENQGIHFKNTISGSQGFSVISADSITFEDTVNITALSINANTININGSAINTSGAQTYGTTAAGSGAGNVVIGNTFTTLTAGNTSAISFKGSVNGDSSDSDTESLTIGNSGSTVQTVTFTGEVGDTAPLNELTVTVGSGGISFAQPVILGTTTSLTAINGNVSFVAASTVDGSNDTDVLTIDSSQVSFGGSVGGTNPLQTIEITANNAVSFNSTLKMQNNGTLTLGSTNANATFSQAVVLGADTDITTATTTAFNGTLTVDNAGAFDVISPNGISFDQAVTLGTTTSLTAINGNVSFADTATVNGTAGTSTLSIPTANIVTFGAAVNNMNDISITANEATAQNAIVFNSTLDATGQVSITASNKSIHFNAAVGNVTPPPANLQVSSKENIRFDSSVAATSLGLSAYATEFDGNVTIDNLVATSGDVYITNASIFTATSGTASFPANLFIVAGNNAVDFSTPTSTNIVVENNMILFSGNVTLGNSLTTTSGDIVLFGAKYNANYNKPTLDTDVLGPIAISGLFKYSPKDPTPLRVGSQPSLSVFPGTTPWSNVAIPQEEGSPADFTASLLDLSGKTIEVGKNFYANGIDLVGTSAKWTLNIPDNNNATNSFAEIYNLDIQNVAVTTVVDGFAWLSAAENVTDVLVGDSSTNTNVAFARPVFRANNTNIAKNTALSGTYTVTDDIVRVEFKYDNGTPDDTSDDTVAFIENSNNEISTALATIKLDTLSDYAQGFAFSEVFSNPECTETTDGKGDLSVFYLRISQDEANASQRWNTDATGVSAGVITGSTTSTDMGRNNIGPATRATIPNIHIPLALETVYETLRDNYKNRIATISYTETADRASPVVSFVYVGQETHNPFEDQKDYDAHNFIELRYSEEVSIANSHDLSETIETNAINQQVSSDFGAISQTGNAGLSIENFITIEKGELETGFRMRDGSTLSITDETIHTFYRNFSLSGDETTAENQSHRLRISLAGLVDGNVIVPNTVNPTKYYPGFITNSTVPSGSVSVIENIGIIDTQKNPIVGNTGYNLAITEPSVSNGLYSGWDVSPPSFARVSWNNDADYEILAIPNSAGTGVEKFEFHLHDNTYDYAQPHAPLPEWTNSGGWGTDISPIKLDTVGGSRPNYTTTTPGSPNTSGGLRASSLVGISDAFTIVSDDSGIGVADGSFEAGYSRLITDVDFFAQGTQSLSSSDDTLYITLVPTYKVLEPILQYNIAYDANVGFATDLAGNRLVSQEPGSANLVSPLITLTLAPFTETGGNQELFLYFNKSLDFDSGIIGHATLDQMPEEFTFFHSDGSEIQDLHALDARVAFATETSTGLILTLNRALSPDELFTINLRPTDEDTSRTIYGDNGARISSNGRYPVTYFGVNTVFPLNAVSPLDFTIDEPLSTGDVSIMNFDGEKSLYAHRDITMQVHVENTVTPLNDTDTIPSLFIDSNEIPITYSERYLEETGEDITFWMPSYSDPASVFSEFYNTESIELFPEETEGGQNRYTFAIDMDDIFRETGYTLQFLFEMGKIRTSIDGVLSTTANTPLYHINIPDLSDLGKFSMFAFKVFEDTQRGGVTILNNVINSNEREETLVEVTLPKSGSLNVTVLTLDGNVVKVLSRGQKAEGNHYFTWNGTNNAGNAVARGMYFVRVVGPGLDETRKVLVVKD